MRTTQGTEREATERDRSEPERTGRDRVGRTDASTASDAVRTVTVRDGETIAYAEYGDPEGTPVLFFHGTPGSRLLGGLYDEGARDRGVRLIAVDRPGYGRSDPWEGRTLADTAAFAVPVLDDAGVDRAAVVGFSGGGPHALALAATRGERVRSVGLVASATPPDCVDDRPTPQRVLEALAARTPRVLGGLLRAQAWVAGRASPSVVLSQYTDDPDAVPDAEAALVARDFREALARSRAGVVTESRLTGRAWDVALDRIDCPVRLWHGERDVNVPVAAARRFAERLPTADLAVRDDAAHLRTLLGSRSAVLDWTAD